MTRVLTLRLSLAVAMCMIWNLNPRGQTTHTVSGRAGNGLSGIHRDDPCDQLPDPRGKALGIDKKCPQGGGSSGVAKGDFNGDGFADLAIGEPGATINGHANAGDVIVIYGSGTGLTTTGVRPELWYQDRFGGSGRARTAQAGDLFGSALASGDFNADGYSDLAIGIPGKNVAVEADGFNTYENLGQVVVAYGSPNGLISMGSDHEFDLGQHFFLRDGHAAPGASLGQSLAWGDFNGDGVGDLAIGAPGYTLDAGIFGPHESEAGAVWILRGTKKTSTSFGGLTIRSDQLFQEDDLQFGEYPAGRLSLAGDHFGAALASGDFDGDGHSDLAIGAPDKSFEGTVPYLRYGPDVGGEVFLLRGDQGGVNTGEFTYRTRNGRSYNQLGRFGAALATGDFNGDGLADLAVGVPLSGSQIVNDAITTQGSGAVEVSLGVSPWAGTTSETLWTQQDMGGTNVSGDRFGAALAAGDFNGDGKADLAIGVPKKNALGFTNSGEVRVIYGSATGLSTTVRNPQVWRDSSGSQTEARFGSSLTAWNFGRNECPGGASFCFISAVIKTADLAIGSPYRNVNGLSDAGSVNVLYGSGSSNGLTGTNRQVHTADSIGFGGLAGAHFGASMY